MSNEIVIKRSTDAVITVSKIQALKDQICKGASDIELQIFVDQCNRTGLDPFQRQCWAVKRWDSNLNREVLTFQTGIDGFRVIANRSEKYTGQQGPYWCGEDGVWTDVWLKNIPPVAAKVGVLRSDFKETMWAVARFSSYAAKKKDGTLTQFWYKMPDLMIAKVAECLALRKAFPNDLSGIYSKEEMEQADVKDVSSKEEDKTLELDQSPIIETQIQVNTVQEKPKPEPITYKNFVFSHPTFKGKRFDEVDQIELSKFMDKIAQDYRNKPMPKDVEFFFGLYDQYMNSIGF